MRSRHGWKALVVTFALVLPGFLAFAGCAARKGTPPASTGGMQTSHGMKAEMPGEVEILLRLAPNQSWKSRFVSSSEVTWTLSEAGGKDQAKTRAVGLELIATQKVASLAGGIARIEVDESRARILRDGKFADAPFKQFAPPNPVAFTLDTSTGKLDFAEMEKAYADWMAGVKESPVGEILGKTFRLDAYVAQLKELYGRPFTRYFGKKLAKGSSAKAEKDFALPFLGPGISLGPVPVETSAWFEGMEVSRKKGEHLLKTAGRYSGEKELSAEELAGQLSEFGGTVPAQYRSTAKIGGQFNSAVDVLSGREVRSASQLKYSTSASFDGKTVTAEVVGKSVLEPVE